MDKIIDLHIHTNCSDGVLSPKEIIDEAIKTGVNIISITDHDTIDAYTDELYDYSKNNNIILITGVEISSKLGKDSIHILGYNFDIDDKDLKKQLELLKNARYNYLHNVAIKLKELGYVLDVQKLEKIKIVTKAHIAEDIINNNLNKELLVKNFNHIPNKSEFIETIMNKGCPAYIKKDSVTPKEASDLIKKAGGKVILAHPVAYKYETSLSDDDILNIIKDIDADGIEANYIYIDKNNTKINEVNKWNKIARDNNLIVTVGSDFHCKDDNHPKVGLIDENLDIENNIIDNIMKK